MWVDWVDSPILSMYTYLRTELAAACTMINGRHTEADQVIGCVCSQIITHNSGFSISHYTICLMALLQWCAHSLYILPPFSPPFIECI